MYLILLIASYLLGSVSYGVVVSKLFFHEDVRDYGSHNSGGTNVTRTYGIKYGIIVIIGDALKSFIPVWFGSRLGIREGILCGLAAIIGHCFPCFHQFHGGKAVASSYGFYFAVMCFIVHDPLFFFIPFGTFAFIFTTTGYVSLGSIISCFVAFVTSIFYPYLFLTIACLAISLFVIYRHRENITRLLNHTESKIDLTKKER